MTRAKSAPHSIPFFLSLAAALTGLACTGGQVGEEVRPPGCTETSREAVDSTFVTPAGFTAAEALSRMTGDLTGTMEWSDDSSSEASIQFQADDSSLEFVQFTLNESSVGSNAPVLCGDQLVIPVVIDAQSLDGRLDESWDTQILVSTVDRGDADFKVSEFSGTLTFEPFVETEGRTITGLVEYRVVGEETSLRLRGLAEETMDEVSSVQIFEIGFLSASSES